jgi:glycosyltransferase involved in cell wall biosynthesis
MRVLHIVSGDLWAGAEVQLFTLVKALIKNKDTTVEVILLNHGKLEKKLLSIGVSIIIIDESKLNSLTILWKLIRIIQQIKPDVIHTHRQKENILGSVAALLNSNIPTLRTSHGASEHSLSWKQLHKRVIFWLDVFCGRYLQRAIIEDLAEKLKKDYPAHKIHVIENGIDLQEIDRHLAEKNPKHLTDTVNIGFAGRLVPVKRIDIILKTARYILDNYPELKTAFFIFGDGPLRDELELLNRKLKTTKIVSFEGNYNDILDRIRNLDALLLTSEHEGLPMILLEAMAIGTPIISNAVGGIPHLLDHGNCGILISENKAKNYALAIKKLAENPQEISKITQLAAQRVFDKYDAIGNAQAYYLYYKSLLM